MALFSNLPYPASRRIAIPNLSLALRPNQARIAFPLRLLPRPSRDVPRNSVPYRARVSLLGGKRQWASRLAQRPFIACFGGCSRPLILSSLAARGPQDPEHDQQNEMAGGAGGALNRNNRLSITKVRVAPLRFCFMQRVGMLFILALKLQRDVREAGQSWNASITAFISPVNEVAG